VRDNGRVGGRERGKQKSVHEISEKRKKKEERRKKQSESG